MSARDNILSRIKSALKKPVEKPFPDIQTDDVSVVFPKQEDNLDVLFAENFKNTQGQFIYCTDETDFVNKLAGLANNNEWGRIYCRESEIINLLQQHGFHKLAFSNMSESPAAITSCEALIARTGSILLSSASQSGRTTSVYTPIHICVAYTNQVVYDIADGLHIIEKKYDEIPSMVTLATGPSRTADIEKTLVVGIHGPQKVFCFLIEK